MRGPAGREGEGRSRESFAALRRSRIHFSRMTQGGRLRPSGPERPAGPVGLASGARAGFVALRPRSVRGYPRVIAPGFYAALAHDKAGALCPRYPTISSRRSPPMGSWSASQADHSQSCRRDGSVSATNCSLREVSRRSGGELGSCKNRFAISHPAVDGKSRSSRTAAGLNRRSVRDTATVLCFRMSFPLTRVAAARNRSQKSSSLLKSKKVSGLER